MNKTVNITGDNNTVTGASAGGTPMGNGSDSEELKTLPTWLARLLTIIGVLFRWLQRNLPIITAVVALIAAPIVSCRADRAKKKAEAVEAQTRRVEQKTEAVLQVQRPVENETAARLLALEKAVQAMQAAAERPRSRRPAPAAVPIRPVTKPRQLPANAEAALKQVHPQATPAVPPAPTAPPVGTGKDGP